MFNIDEIEVAKLNLVLPPYGKIEFFKTLVGDGRELNDETISWSFNNPPIFAAKESEEMRQIMQEAAQSYNAKKKSSIKLTKLVKSEFYEFLCLDTKYYKKEKTLIGGNINKMIVAISAAIGTKHGIELAIVTSIILALIVSISKMTKRIACVYLKPDKL